jgi:hypothetical protein
MTKLIAEYHLKGFDVETIDMRKAAEILTVFRQNGVPTLYCLCPKEERATGHRTFLTLRTGAAVPPNCRYIGSYEDFGGAFVEHVFEKLPEA